MQSYLVISSLIVAGFGIALWGVYLMFQGMVTHRWPSTQGEIIESGIRDYNEPDNYGYTFHAKYRFCAHGAMHTGTRIQFGLRSFLNKETADLLAKRYPMGASVTVFHHPKKSIAVLEKGFSPPTYFLLLLGFFVAAISGCIALSLPEGCP